MVNFSKWITGKSMMFLCVAACALPFVVIMIIGGKANLSWLGLLACVGMHLVMMKMMSGRKSCHVDEESNDVVKKSLPSPENK